MKDKVNLNILQADRDLAKALLPHYKTMGQLATIGGPTGLFPNAQVVVSLIAQFRCNITMMERMRLQQLEKENARLQRALTHASQRPKS